MANERRGRGRRSLRVGEALRHALAEMLLRGAHPGAALDGVSITVSEVRVSPDLRHARAYVLPLGGRATTDVLAELRRLAPQLRGPLARALHLRHAPAIEFEVDGSFDEATRIEDVLRETGTVGEGDDEPGGEHVIRTEDAPPHG